MHIAVSAPGYTVELSDILYAKFVSHLSVRGGIHSQAHTRKSNVAAGVSLRCNESAVWEWRKLAVDPNGWSLGRAPVLAVQNTTGLVVCTAQILWLSRDVSVLAAEPRVFANMSKRALHFSVRKCIQHGKFKLIDLAGDSSKSCT